MRLLLTPFPQKEFNQTEDRNSEDQILGVTVSIATPIFTPTAQSISLPTFGLSPHVSGSTP
jgi:hypothetical protein